MRLLGGRRSAVVGFLLLLLLLGGIGAAATGILSQRDGGAEGEAEANRHDDKLLHFLGDLLDESTTISFFFKRRLSPLKVSYRTQHEAEAKEQLKCINKEFFFPRGEVAAQKRKPHHSRIAGKCGSCVFE